MVRAFFRHILNSVKTAVRQSITRFSRIFTPVATPFSTKHKSAIRFVTILTILVTSVSVAGVFSYTRGGANAAANNNLNFQGRLLTNTGSAVPDGSYNIEFNLYTQQAPGGTTEWTEDYLVNAGQGVTLKNGYFSVNLGSITSFSTSIAWDQQQYLGMTVRGTGSCAFAACTPADLEMTPRFKLTAVPYAFRAAALMDSTNTNAYTADDLIQKAPTLAQALNSANAAIRLNQQGAGGLLQLQNSATDIFTIGNTGAVLARSSADSASAFDVQNAAGDSFLKVDTLGKQATFGSNVGTAKTVLQGGTNGVQITSGSDVTIGVADANATLLVLDTKNTLTDPTGTNGAMYYNSAMNKFRCFENGAWSDCLAGGSTGGASASFVSGLQNVTANQSGLAAETMVFTSSTAVSNVAGITGFTAPADGSFRTCLVKNNAAITAGTIGLRWRVNGASVGSPVCAMDSVNPRQATSVLNDGVVRFNAGDTISVAFDTSNLFAPTGTNDYTIYWSVSYSSGGSSPTGVSTLQDAYDNSVSASILTADNKDITFQLDNTAIDSDFAIDVAAGATGQLQVKRAGTTNFSVDGDGNINTNAGITLGTSSSTTAGTIRWTGLDFEGFDGSNWVSLTGGSGGSGVTQNTVTVVKGTNEVVNNSTTLQPDDELTFPIGPNETWTYRFVAQASSGTTPDLKFAVSAPVGAVCRSSFSDPEGGSSAAQYDCSVPSVSVPGNTASDLYEVTGVVTNGPTAGNVTLEWSQFTLNATDTIVYAGSYLTASRVTGPGGFGQAFSQGGNSYGATGVLGTTDNNDLSIVTNNTEKIRVTAGGNVGIGAGTTPSALLSVGTASAFQVNTSGNVQTSGTLSVQGQTTFTGNVVGNSSATLTTGTTGVTPGINTSTVVLAAAGSFANNDVIYIDNAGQDYYTRIVSGGGTTTLTVSPIVSYDASAPVTKYTVQNIGATSSDYASQSNRFFQGYFLGGVVVGAGSTTLSDGELSRTSGDITINPGSGGELVVNGTINATTINVTTITGDGAGITNLNGANIVGASIPDAGLSSNVALLTGSQSFTGLKTFDAGLTVTTGQAFTINGDAFTDLTGTGLTINSGALETTLGVSVDLAAEVNGTLGLGNGGTNATSQQGAINNLSGLTTLGDLLYFDGTNATRLPRGSNGQCLTSDATTITWGSCTTGAATSVGAIDGGVYSANGASLSGGVLNLQTADGTHTGLINSTTQDIGGVKTFVDGLTISATKSLTISGDALTDLTGSNLVNNSGALGVSATPGFTSVTAATFTGSAGVTLSSGGGADLTLDSASNVLVLSDATLRRAAVGTTALQLNDTANTTFSITNTDGTAVANLSVEGAVTAASFSGDGSALTNLTATGLTGTINDGRLSTNVALLTGTQTFSGLKTFGAGLTITAGQNFTVNGDILTDLTGTNLTNSSGALSLVDNPNFATSVSSPTFTSTAGLTLDSGNNTISFAASDTTLQRVAAGTFTVELNDAATTVLTLNNNGGGVADLNLADGGLTTAGTSRLTNTGALQNITGLSIASGGASVTGTATFNSDLAANGNTTIGNATTDRLTITSQILGTSGMVFQGLTDNGFTTTFNITEPTAVNTINVPDASGTILLLGTAAAQIDASTNSSIFINKTGASGNLLTLQKSATGVFTIGNDGATSVSTTSTAALMVANAGAALDYFSVDTSGSIVRIGDATADGIGTILVLDTKNTVGDPASVEGAQYYNSAYGTLRCDQGVRGWTDCLGTSKPNTRRTTRLDYQGSGTTFAGQGDIATVVANATAAVAATTADPAMINQATNGTNNSVTSISGNLNYSSTNTPSMQTYVQLPSIATERIWVGVTNQTPATMGGSANPAGNYAAFRYDTSVGGETTWKCITKNNVTQTINNSGVTVSTTGIKMEIIMTASAVAFKIDGVIVCTNTTTLPTPGTMMRYAISLTNLNAASHNIRLGWIFLDTDF